jgi:hypothetical protein
MAGVFQNIASPPPLPPGDFVPPAFGAGGGHIRWVERGGGGSIFRKTSDTALYSTYASTLCHKVKIRDWGKSVHVVFNYLFRGLLHKDVNWAGGMTPSPLITTIFLYEKTLNMSVKDEVTVLLLIGVSFIPVTFSIYDIVIHVTSEKNTNKN